MVRIGSVQLKQAAILAPMAGITDVPFRDVVAQFGAGLVVSEMIASQEIVQAKIGVREKAQLGNTKVPTSVQLAGRDPYWIAEAARKVTDLGAQIIDINMGCPAKKVTSGYSGAALMRTPDLAQQLIEAVVAATQLPVTLKMRLGWDDTENNAPVLAKMAEAAGVQLITVHGRTRCQFYKGRANWAAIRHVVDVVSIPVIANGDIIDASTAEKALQQSGAQAVMMGRGAQGAPWRVAQVGAALDGKEGPQSPNPNALTDLVAAHYEDMLSFYGLTLGRRVARKHLGWYMDQANTDKETRRSILTADSEKDVIRLLPRAFYSERQAA